MKKETKKENSGLKIEKNKLTIGLGKNTDKNFYKVNHVFKEDLESFGKQNKEIVETALFTAEPGSQFIDHKKKILYIGLGDKKQYHPRKLAKVYIRLGEQISKWVELGLEIELEKELLERISADQLLYHLSCSLQIGAFSIDKLTKGFSEKTVKTGTITFLVKGQEEGILQKALDKSNIVARYINTARIIEHLPSNHFTPEEFVSISKEIAKECKLKITVFDQEQLKKEKMNGILSVCQGSDKKPKLIILEYKPDGKSKKKPLAIVGKGLTFDSGGISIKPSAEMHEMKYDMCGAAATINAIGAIASLGLNVPVVAAIGVAENMPSGSAIKPGDVYTAYNGVTVEVQNTDAEGRLVLGDVLSYISEKYKPEYMVDLATLTGAIIIALGHEAAGVMSNSEELSELLQKASKSSEDRIWEMPLWDEYSEDLKSDIADVRNITGGRAGGSITAAKFLAKFVPDETKWAHIDIAGTAWRGKASGTQCSGPTGYGIRLLVALAEELNS